MRDAAALLAALVMAEQPSLVRKAKHGALPKGMTFLLEVAAGEPDALDEARTRTGRPDATLRSSASFFIEQLLLMRGADSYRVLGVDPNAPSSDLRRHMALLMKWLHPDVATASDSDCGFGRGAYALRVTKAWEDLKSDERRTAYDDDRQSRHRRPARVSPQGMDRVRVRSESTPADAAAGKPFNGTGGHRRLIMRRMESDDLFSRLLRYLRRHR